MKGEEKMNCYLGCVLFRGDEEGGVSLLNMAPQALVRDWTPTLLPLRPSPRTIAKLDEGHGIIVCDTISHDLT